jgi:hypothetical protein
MTHLAKGTFDVRLASESLSAIAAETQIARLSIDKQFSGDLEGTSNGEMLAARSDIEGSAGYVAIERVSATLHGRRGTFVLQHSSTMTRGAPRQSISVVPDTGTGELTGLSGTMTIIITDGNHFYEFEYSIDP